MQKNSPCLGSDRLIVNGNPAAGLSIPAHLFQSSITARLPSSALAPLAWNLIDWMP